MTQGINGEFSCPENMIIIKVIFKLSFNARQQLLKLKRFFYVIICAGFEAENQVIQSFFCR